jgi:hypothetical protein
MSGGFVSRDWLERASDLLAETDPGDTPFLVDSLMVEQAITAIAGQPKVGKTWIVLELAVSIVNGRPAFGRFRVSKAGPVIVVLEESGREALHRRLDALTRGRAIERSALDKLHFAANRRVRLDDKHWQHEITAACLELGAVALFIDPLARMKEAGRDENEQRSMAPVIEFLRDLRDQTGTAPAFVHHLVKAGVTMRGSGDLESVWETRIGVTRSGLKFTLSAEHRESEEAPRVELRLIRDGATRTVRLEPTARTPPVAAAEVDCERWLAAYVGEHPGQPRGAVEKAYSAAHGDRGRNLARRVLGDALEAIRTGEPHKWLAAGSGPAPNGVYLYPASEASSLLAGSPSGAPGEQTSPLPQTRSERERSPLATHPGGVGAMGGEQRAGSRVDRNDELEAVVEKAIP